MSKNELKTFVLSRDVESASGTQYFYCKAVSKDEAFDNFCRGECELFENEVEVDELGDIRMSNIYEEEESFVNASMSASDFWIPVVDIPPASKNHLGNTLSNLLILKCNDKDEPYFLGHYYLEEDIWFSHVDGRDLTISPTHYAIIPT